MFENIDCDKCGKVSTEVDDCNHIQIYENGKCTGSYMCQACEQKLTEDNSFIFDEDFEQYLSINDYNHRHLAKCFFCEHKIANKPSKEIYTGENIKSHVHIECMPNSVDLCDCKNAMLILCPCNQYTDWCYDESHGADEYNNILKDTIIPAHDIRHLCLDCS
jgi:hypothetical protein